MKVSKREQYAIRMMIDLGQNSGDGQPVGVRAIAERQQIARRYLEQIAAQLRRAGLVYARQGQAGGYVLARPACEISVGEIIEAIAGPVFFVECLADESTCDRSSSCPSRRMWSLLETLMRSMLHQYHLDDLLDSRLPASSHADTIARMSRCPLVSMNISPRKPEAKSQGQSES